MAKLDYNMEICFDNYKQKLKKMQKKKIIFKEEDKYQKYQN